MLDEHTRYAAIRFSEQGQSRSRPSDPTVEIVWTHRERARLAIGVSEVDRAVALLENPTSTFAGEATLRALAHDHPDDVLVAAAVRLLDERSGAHGWIAVGAGRKGQTAWLDIRADEPALASVIAMTFAE